MRVGPTPVEEALRRLGDFGSRAALNVRLEVVFQIMRAHLVAVQGDFDAARSFASQARALAQEHGLDGSHARFVAGDVERLAGDASAAERELRAVCEHYEQVGELGFLSSTAPFLVEVVLAQGRDEEALLLTERWRPERLTLPEDADAQTHWRRVRAKVLARRGEFDEAERVGREAVAIASATDVLELRAQALADLGEVLRLAGRPDESAAPLKEAIALYDEKGNVVEIRRLRGLLTQPAIEV
jgi:tetratricopeptide (TPR) repeat protein